MNIKQEAKFKKKKKTVITANAGEGAEKLFVHILLVKI